ncbi:hypothetical protein, partial [Allorhizocola rhizosphaerae]|uniref:hypothetical protein n=1 Tax=Allorhizocola rhizosphaerae TaxID=1872709 RepID=UPI000E3D90AE
FAATPAAAASAADQGRSGAAPMAAPVSVAPAGDVGVQASYYCYDFVNHGNRWTGYCRVYSGEIRTITYCSNSAYNSVGAWIGPRTQPWFVYGDCGPSSVVNIGIQTRG